MKSVIRQLYNGDLCLSEQTATCVSEFCTARDIAVQAHDIFEDNLCQPMKQELDDAAVYRVLGKYGNLRLTYLHKEKPQTYRELLYTGKLTQHCAEIEQTAFEMAERI